MLRSILTKRITTSFPTRTQFYFSQKSNTLCTFAIETKMPVFPMSKHVVQLSSSKFKEFQKQEDKKLTAIVRKDQSNTKLEEAELLELFETIGTYCSYELRPDNLQIIMNGLQRAKIEDLAIEGLAENQDTVDEDGSLVASEDQDDLENLSDQEKQKKLMSQILAQRNLSTDEHHNQLLCAKIQFIDDPPFDLDIQLETHLKHLIDIYSKILYMNKSQIPLVNYNLQDAYRIVDSLGGFLTTTKYYDKDVMFQAYQTIPLKDRLEQVHGLMNKYLVFLQYFSDVGTMAQQNIKQRKAQEFYNEMFKIVKGAVEGKKGKEAIVETMQKKISQTNPPDHVKKIFQEEVQKYLQLDDMSSESNIIRTYLDWVSSLPYGVYCEENSDLQKAQDILNQEHYGMDEIKDRILEFIAVSTLSSTKKGRILLLVGPPGVGKTSLAASIAKAIGRPFARIAMGGEGDSSFLKGHRKTYIGAYPGKIVQSMKQTEKQNCVILLDEIDKLGKSEMHGDPQSNLLEILDPEQNKAFTDNYLDYPIDLSQVLFICSANTIHSISPPLLDRMDMIQLSSYTNNEKKEIYRRHLLPKAITEVSFGLKDEHNFKIDDDVVDVLVKDYAREPGVRSLEKQTRKMTEKIAYKIMNQMEEGQELEEIRIKSSDLVKILGQPKFSDFKFNDQLPVGVVTGLAYTEYGGSLIFLEVSQSKFMGYSKQVVGGLKATGSLGDVMQESMQLAYTYAKLFSYEHLQNEFLEKNEVHIHAPEGAIPKDGPSAGIAITTALLSLCLNKPIPKDIGMTGELSLNGLVLPIGGCKEKILAAQREGLKRLIFPERNRANVNRLKDEVKQGLDIYFVKEYKEVFDIVFPQ